MSMEDIVKLIEDFEETLDESETIYKDGTDEEIKEEAILTIRDIRKLFRRIRKITNTKSKEEVHGVIEHKKIKVEYFDLEYDIDTDTDIKEEDIEEEIQNLTLLDHQIESFEKSQFILSKSPFLLDYSKMGSGKTFRSGKDAEALNNSHVIIIAPKMVLIGGVWLKVSKLANLNMVKYDDGEPYMFGYEKLRGSKDGKQDHKLYIRTTVKSRDEKGKEIKDTFYQPTKFFEKLVEEGLTLIFDECHKFKNKDTLIFKCILALLKSFMNIVKLSKSNSKVIFLSGTPITKEEEAINLCMCLGIIKSDKLYSNEFGRIDFNKPEERGAIEMVAYCEQIDKKTTNKIIENYPFGINKKTIVSTLFKLFTGVIVKNLSVTMPDPKIDVPLDAKNGFYHLSTKRIPLLVSAINEFKSAAYKIIEGRLNKKSMEAAMAQMMAALVKIEYQQLEIFIRKAIDDLTDDPNIKVCLTFNFISSIKIATKLLAKYKPLILYGKVPQNKRKGIIDKYNESNDENRLLICNLKVSALGIDLDDKNGNYPRKVYISGSFDIINTYQAIYRYYRAGTKSSPRIRIVYTLGHTNLKVLDAYARKSNIMKDVLEEQVKHGVKFPGDFEKDNEDEYTIREIDYPLTLENYKLEEEDTIDIIDSLNRFKEEIGYDEDK